MDRLGENEVSRNKIDKVIGEYIELQLSSDFSNILSKDERLEVTFYLSELANGLFGWYPFQEGCRILQVGSWFGAFTELLCSRSDQIVVIEEDAYRAHMTEKRLGYLNNLNVLHTNMVVYSNTCSTEYDYVIFAVDEYADEFPTPEAYTEIIDAAKKVMGMKGKLLFAIPNRFGLKYFCGEPDPYTKVRFDGMTENNSGLYRFDRKELLEFIKSFGFRYVKMYYPMPDHHCTQLIYTDEYRPGIDLSERLRVYINHKTKRLLHETLLADSLARNDVMPFFSNSFLVEAGNTSCSEIIYSAISTERDRKNAFATNIYTHTTVAKVPLYLEGKYGIRRLMKNTEELRKRGIPIINMEEKDGAVYMAYVQGPSMSLYMRSVAKENTNMFVSYMDKLYGYILASSDYVSADKNCMKSMAPEEDWGVILEKAYIEMIPVNCFYEKGNFLFYDQEYTKENCPANYVIYRAIRDMYAFAPEIEKMIPLAVMKRRYGLISIWKYYEQEEEHFQKELRKRDVYRGFFPWVKNLDKGMQENRRELDMQDEKKKDDFFNAVSNLDGRRIILFGSGRMADYYLNRYGMDYPPIFIVDNNQDKWGSRKKDIEIKSPEAIIRLMDGTYRVVITIKDYDPIVEQLEQMGIRSDSYRIYNREMDLILGGKLTNTTYDGKYNIGYVTGVFDLFHIGHLNLLKNCKSRCHYLVAGVLTDELTKQDKHKTPFIPFEERMEIVRQCKYVDRVIPVDFHNTNKVDAWKELKYGCLFSGSDHEGQPYWTWLQRQLRSLGSELEFFPYTQSTSSTMLQTAIREAAEK